MSYLYQRSPGPCYQGSQGWGKSSNNLIIIKNNNDLTTILHQLTLAASVPMNPALPPCTSPGPTPPTASLPLKGFGPEVSPVSSMASLSFLLVLFLSFHKQALKNPHLVPGSPSSVWTTTTLSCLFLGLLRSSLSFKLSAPHTDSTLIPPTLFLTLFHINYFLTANISTMNSVLLLESKYVKTYYL